MKLLNGYIYWPDIIQIGLLAAILAALVMKKKPPKEDDEVIKQEISDKLDKLIKDVKSTIK